LVFGNVNGPPGINLRVVDEPLSVVGRVSFEGETVSPAIDPAIKARDKKASRRLLATVDAAMITETEKRKKRWKEELWSLAFPHISRCS